MSHPVTTQDTTEHMLEEDQLDMFDFIEEDKCEWCNGTGMTPVDEYSKEGQVVGVGTLEKKCICQYDEPADFSGADNEDR